MRHANRSHDPAPIVLDAIHAFALMAAGMLVDGRLVECQQALFSAAKLAIPSGLHQIRSLAIPPSSSVGERPPMMIPRPTSEADVKRRVGIFWQLLCLDYTAAIIMDPSVPVSLPWEDCPAEVQVETVWPDFSQSRKEESIASLFQCSQAPTPTTPSEVVGGGIDYGTLRVKAIVLLERAVRVSAQREREGVSRYSTPVSGGGAGGVGGEKSPLGPAFGDKLPSGLGERSPIQLGGGSPIRHADKLPLVLGDRLPLGRGDKSPLTPGDKSPVSPRHPPLRRQTSPSVSLRTAIKETDIAISNVLEQIPIAKPESRAASLVPHTLLLCARVRLHETLAARDGVSQVIWVQSAVAIVRLLDGMDLEEVGKGADILMAYAWITSHSVLLHEHHYVPYLPESEHAVRIRADLEKLKGLIEAVGKRMVVVDTMFRGAVDQFHTQRKPSSPRATPPESADVKMEYDGSSDRSSSRSGSSRRGSRDESNQQGADGESLKRRRPVEQTTPNKRISPNPRDLRDESMENEETDELAEDI
ncbi:hypothetical protein BDV93DRAFT_335951 [Ceratobasidium sp. AG-I]|nr:hypothetical protein BDV93DRAFT_335951 [Ceratobasidium sp. AG-I]